MEIKTCEVGLLQTNCYILKKDNKVLIIDPGDEVSKIIANTDGKVVGIIITHYHFDHIGALEKLQNKYKVNIVDYQNELILKPFNYEIIKTPGHKKDCISIYFREEQLLFCGDFIFKGTIGRTDLLDGNIEEMKESIKNILNFNDNLVIYPGHGEITTLKEEKENLKEIINNC